MESVKRLTAHKRGYGSRWKKARDTYLRAHPLCSDCESRGQLVAARVVDHIDPHKGDQAKFWDTANWQPLCKPCHDAKTAREDGGFGNKGDKTTATCACDLNGIPSDRRHHWNR